jgi:hypothetical protein
MFSRILLSTVAAASLAAVTPALAGDAGKDADTRDASTQTQARALPKCCEQMAMEHRQLIEQKKAADEQSRRLREEDPFVRNQSFGG